MSSFPYADLSRTHATDLVEMFKSATPNQLSYAEDAKSTVLRERIVDAVLGTIATAGIAENARTLYGPHIRLGTAIVGGALAIVHPKQGLASVTTEAEVDATVRLLQAGRMTTPLGLWRLCMNVQYPNFVRSLQGVMPSDQLPTRRAHRKYGDYKSAYTHVAAAAILRALAPELFISQSVSLGTD